jgi:dTDP-4-dehydrorhamnose 3,5-epimerase
MKVNAIPRIAGALTFQPTPHADERGFFCRTFDVDVMRAAGLDPVAFIQHSLSRSVRGVVRGLHVRRGDGEAKLVRCSSGAIFDVIVDLRHTSPTYQNWESFELRDDEQVTLYVPAGCAHGFQALTDTADVSYMIDRAHDASEDVSIAFDDPGLAIPWPLPVTVMSSRDRLAPPLADAAGLLAQDKSAGALQSQFPDRGCHQRAISRASPVRRGGIEPSRARPGVPVHRSAAALLSSSWAALRPAT